MPQLRQRRSTSAYRSLGRRFSLLSLIFPVASLGFHTSHEQVTAAPPILHLGRNVASMHEVTTFSGVQSERRVLIKIG
jgi:hypothetical protein